MARAFTAVNLKEEGLIRDLEEAQKHIDLGFKLIPPEKMHITFEFFKDASKEELELIKEAMDAVDFDSFELEIKGLGAFPSDDHIRVVWAGAESPEMHELHKQLGKHEAVASTENDFKPHVTLARIDKVSGEKKKKLQKVMKEFEDHSFGNIAVEEVKLYRSDLKPRGAVYTELYSVEL